MKKHITFTALLVAGTAFANAAATLPSEDDLLFKFDYSTNSDAPQINNTTWGWTHYGSEVPSINDGVATFSNGGPYTSSYVSFDVNNFTLSFDLGNVQNTGGNNIDGGVVFAFGVSYDQTIFFVSANTTSIALKRWDGPLTTIVEAEVDGLTSSDLVKNIVVSNSAEGSFIAVNGNVVAKSDEYFSSSTTLSSEICIGAVFGGGIEKLNGTLDNIALYNVAATIPEPSAFGLLAGLGALALVGTRRRRR